jgi:hypothetical protein
MANGNNLTDFITWGVQTYPADKYVLVMWDHGGAIDGYGNDENSEKSYSVNQIKDALAKAYAKTQTKFEVLGFDACLMANMECLMNYRTFANFYVASEELEPGHGWNYVPILRSLAGNTARDGGSLGKVIADGFLQQGAEQETSGVTLSVVNTSKTEDLTSALNRFIADLTVSVRKSGSIKYLPVAKARSQVEEYGKSEKSPEQSLDVVDLVDFAKAVKKADPSLGSSADGLIKAMNNAVVYKVKDKTRPNANGLSIFLPFNKLEDKAGMPQVLKNYNMIPFSQSWQKFIKEYTDIAIGDKQKPQVPEGVKEENNVIEAFCTSDDFDDAYVVLIAPDEKDENVINFLGVMMPDDVEEVDGGVNVKYTWDGQWIGINGEPANVADMYSDEYEDEDGNTHAITIVEIPAMINDEYVTLEFTVEEDGSYELTNITPEIEDGLFPKQTFDIQPGDKLTLIYDKYNMETDEEIEEEGQSFTLNSIDDIELGIINLKAGDYMLGYLISDVNQNEEFFLNENIFTVKK